MCLIKFFLFFTCRVERSKVRVTFFQSGKPQQVSPPETHIGFFGENNNSILIESLLYSETSSIDEKMAATVVTTIPPTYDRQMRYVCPAFYSK